METSVTERLAQLRNSGVDNLVIGAPDINGNFRTKRFSLGLFTKENVEIAFSDYLFAADRQEALMRPRAGFAGYFPTEAAGLPDVYVRPDWDLLRVLPWDPKTALVLGDFYTLDGEEVPISPRGVLKRVIRRLESMGLQAMAGCEFEFFIFRGRPEEVRANTRSLVPFSTGPAYSYVRGAEDELVLGSVRRFIEQAGIPLEAANPEAAPGQNEITIRYADALAAADHAFLYKQFISELLAREQLTASFIAKLTRDGYGNSGHIHVSLRDANGNPLMTAPDGDFSDTTYQALSGYLSTLPEFASFYAPYVNSYRRYQTPYSLGGDNIAWGVENRSCAVRLIHAGTHGTRLELRTPGSDMNPYVALAAALAGVGHGIEQKLQPPAACSGDAYQDESISRVPNDLTAATHLLHDSTLARDWLGSDFVDYYEETRFWETEQHRLAVTDWEVERYL